MNQLFDLFRDEFKEPEIKELEKFVGTQKHID
jgi:hypothetical protein